MKDGCPEYDGLSAEDLVMACGGTEVIEAAGTVGMKRVSIFFVLLLLALTTCSAWCGTLRCSSCGKVIQSKYYDFPGKKYCIYCYEHVLPRCSVCRRPIPNNYFTQGSKTYCPSCYNHEKSLPRCSVCRQLIRTKYYNLENKYYCLTCYKRSKHLNYDDDRPVCVCCHKRTDKYSVFPDGGPVCKKCLNDKRNPRCEVCQVPINYQSARPIPYYGVYVCLRHRNSVVVDQDSAQTLMQAVRGNIISTLGTEMIIRQPVELKLVNRQDLYKAYGSGGNTKLAGFCHTEGRGTAMTHTIYILGGLNRSTTFTVMAHELAHAWHDENNSDVLYLEGRGNGRNRFMEGFAEWVSYKTTEAFGDKRELQGLLTKQNDNYSKGLRDFLQYEKQHGKDATLEAARTRTSL